MQELEQGFDTYIDVLSCAVSPAQDSSTASDFSAFVPAKRLLNLFQYKPISRCKPRATGTRTRFRREPLGTGYPSALAVP